MNIETLIERLKMFKGNASLIMTADEVQQHIDFIESQQKTIEDMKTRESFLEAVIEGWEVNSSKNFELIEKLFDRLEK